MKYQRCFLFRLEIKPASTTTRLHETVNMPENFLSTNINETININSKTEIYTFIVKLLTWSIFSDSMYTVSNMDADDEIESIL